MFATSIGGDILRGKGGHGVLCRLNCVIHAWALLRGLYTMQGAIQVLCFTLPLPLSALWSDWRLPSYFANGHVNYVIHGLQIDELGSSIYVDFQDMRTGLSQGNLAETITDKVTNEHKKKLEKDSAA